MIKKGDKMRKGPSNATKWFYWFSLGVALLIAHAILSNVAGIYSFASRIALVLMPFFLAIIIAFLFFKPASSLEHFIKNKLKIKKGARVISILIVYVIFGLLIFLFGRNLYDPIKDSLTELVESVPGYLNEAKTFIRENRDNQILAAINIDNIIEKVNSFDLSTYISPERIFDYIEKVKGVFTTILDIFVVIILSIYILLGRGSIKEYLKKFGKAMFDKKEYLKYGDNLAAPRKNWSLYSSPRILVRQIPSKLPYCINACFTDEVILNDRNSMNIINISCCTAIVNRYA